MATTRKSAVDKAQDAEVSDLEVRVARLERLMGVKPEKKEEAEGNSDGE